MEPLFLAFSEKVQHHVALLPMRQRDGHFGSIQKYMEAFLSDDGCPWSKAKNYLNCIHFPIRPGHDSSLVLDILAVPKLHLMLGTCNKILDVLNTLWGEYRAYAWAHKQNICRVNYHGGTMEGPACKRLLLKSALLCEALPKELNKFAWALFRALT